MKQILIVFVVCIICACQAENIVLDNGSLRPEFDRKTANVVSITNLETDYEYLDATTEPQQIWGIVPFVEGFTNDEIDIAQMSTYIYKNEGSNLFPHKRVVPRLYSSAWHNKEGDILLTFTNVNEDSKKEMNFSINLGEVGVDG